MASLLTRINSIRRSGNEIGNQTLEEMEENQNNISNNIEINIEKFEQKLNNWTILNVKIDKVDK